MKLGKIEAIQKLEIPNREKEVQAFLGFANYYYRIIHDYARQAKPLTALTKGKSSKGTEGTKGEPSTGKGNSQAKVPFSWGQQQQEAFEDLKRAFQEAPILVQFDPNHPTLLETNASNQAISGVLSQGHLDPNSDTGKVIWKLVDCHARTLTEQQRNWSIYDKELWAILSSLAKWRLWLSGHPVEVHIDRHGLQYFQTKQKLNA